jgi:hypothetical protein
MTAFTDRPILSPERELDKIISLAQVEEVNGLSPETIKRHHADKLIQLSPHRVGMRLRDALFLKP